MAYREVACGSMSEVPALVAAFAQELGWQTSNPNLAQPTRDLRRPIEPSDTSGQPDADIRTATTFRLASFIDNAGPAGNANSNAGTTNTHELRLSASIDAFAALRARISSSWRSNGDQRQPLILLPTKLHLFGAGLPAPFIHCVIEYAFNLYRHLYIGSLDRTGTQTPSDVVAVANGVNRRNSSQFNYGYRAWQGLFSGFSGDGSFDIARSPGGIVLPEGFRSFSAFSLGTNPRIEDTGSALREGVVFGGARDGFQDALLSHGFSPFSGDNVLQPVNLYGDFGVAGPQRRAIALGSVRGVRNVNMRNLEPGASVVVGNRRWRVFPQLSKQEDPIHRAGPRSPSEVATNWNGFAANDTSHYWGVALLEGDV